MEHAILRAGPFPHQLEVGQLVAHPALIEPEHPGLVAPGLLPDAGKRAHRGWNVHHGQAPAVSDRLRKGRVRALDLDRGLVGAQPVTETPVDRRLRGIKRRQRLASLAHVIQLAPHHRRQQAAAAMGGEHADPGDTAARQSASRDGHLIGEDARGGDDLWAIEKRERAVKLGDLPGDREFIVGGKRRTEGAPHQRRIRPLLLQPDRPELEPCRCAYR